MVHARTFAHVFGAPHCNNCVIPVDPLAWIDQSTAFRNASGTSRPARSTNLSIACAARPDRPWHKPCMNQLRLRPPGPWRCFQQGQIQ